MGKWTFLIALFLVVETTIGQISIEPSAGYTRAWQNYGDVELPDDAVTHIHGFNAFVGVFYTVSKRFSIGVAPGFIRRGAACIPGWNQGINPNPIFPGDSRFLLDYVQLPFSFRVEQGFWKERFTMSASLGYGLSAMVSATEETINTETNEVVLREKMRIGDSQNIARFDHGAHVSAKLGWNFGKHQLFGSTEVYFGFRDAERFNTSKNRSISYNIGYAYRF